MTSSWGELVFFVGGVGCVMNLFYGVTRYLWYRIMRRQLARSLEYAAPLPWIASMAVGLSLFDLPHHPWLLGLAVGLILIDTGGIHWWLVLNQLQERFR